jgi:hypothetical protein
MRISLNSMKMPVSGFMCMAFGTIASVFAGSPDIHAEQSMGLPDTVLAALVAGIVSVVIGVLTFYATTRGFENQRKMQERSQEHALSLKLMDLRLAAYPEAFEITDELNGDILFATDLTQRQLESVLGKLVTWNKKKAGFILSTESIGAWYRIRSSLRLKPGRDGLYSEDTRRKIWEAKNKFRSVLREDLALLYVDEVLPSPNSDTG